MKAAIYARYSSDLQSAASIEDQIRVCRERASRDGFEVIETFTDRAISGGSLQTRPGILALMEAAREGGFDLVLAEALDRLSRDQEDIAGIFKRLAHAGVKIITLSEGEVNELHIGLKGTMNALFLKDLAAKTKRGQRGRVEVGKIPGGNSYGYRIIRSLRDDGTITTGEREVDQDQAAVIRRIFEEYISGLPPRRIAAGLNTDGILSPRGSQWNASTINGNRQRRNGILNNELYCGWITYNRQSFLKDPGTGRRQARLNAEHLWVRQAVPHLRIVDDITWEAAQALKARFASKQGNKRQTRKRLLTGLVRCGACGGTMTVVNRERYYCSAKRERGTCSSSVGIKAVDLETRVLEGLKSILTGKEDLVQVFVEEFKRETSRLQKDRSGHERQHQRDLTKVNAAIKRCLAFITGGDGDPGLVRDELQNLEVKKRDLEHQLASLDDAMTITLHPNLADLYTRKVGELRTLLDDEQTRPQAMEVIRSMIDRIEVHAGDRRGRPEVILVGALAPILTYLQPTNNNAAPKGDGAGRVLLVAGAGFEPATFRL